MGVLPHARIRQIEWFEQRLDAWTADPAAIGLSAAQVAQLATRIAAARADYERAQQARNESRSATAGFHASTDTLVGEGRDLIATVKAFAEASGDAQVYTRAIIPPPADPSPLPPPGTPTRFRAALKADGSLALSWRADNPPGSSGTIYEIMRADNGGPMAFLATVGTRRFTDTTVPAGVGTVVYQITGVRSTSRGSPARFIVRLGTKDSAAENTRTDSGSEDDMNIAA